MRDLFLFYCIVAILGLFFTIIADKFEEFMKFTWYALPSKLYSVTKMNKLGCIISSIALCIAMILFLPIVSLCHIVYFIFHIGRKD